MRVYGLCMVKDEQDIIGYTLPRMAAQLDHVLIADNLSTDETWHILHSVADEMGNITVLRNDEPAYLQSAKMTALAHKAREMGATWVVPFDADECWDMGGSLKDMLTSDHISIIHAQLFDHVVTGLDDPAIVDPLLRIGYRRGYPVSLPKVACRTLPGLTVDQGNHSCSYPGPVESFGIGTVHHYPYRSVEQMVRKVRNGSRAYTAAGPRIPDHIGAHWRQYGQLLEARGELAIQEVFETWFYEESPEGKLVYDPCLIEMPVKV